MHPTTARIAELVSARGVDGASVLEIGGGIGDLQIALLEAGADRAVSAELSPAYDEVAEALLRDAGLADRVDRRIANVAEEPETVDPADVVVMNSVVCCYPDVEQLVTAAAAKTRRILAISYPRRVWYLRAFAVVANFVDAIRKDGFRWYIHPPAQIRAAAEAQGLKLVHREHGWVDEIVLIERPGG
jgi:predicted RNA methylase